MYSPLHKTISREAMYLVEADGVEHKAHVHPNNGEVRDERKPGEVPEGHHSFVGQVAQGS